MKKIFNNYKQSIIFLISIIIGCVLGLTFGEKINVIAPLGDLFINMMFVIIVPLVFLTISTSIAKMENPKRLGKIMGSIVLSIVILSLVAVIIGFIGTKVTYLISETDSVKIKEVFDESITNTESLNLLERTVSLISVSDFSELLSRNNVIAILIFGLLFGFAIRNSKEKGKQTLEVLDSLNTVILKLLELIMYYAPIGIASYLACLVGTFGDSLVIGFIRTFVIYTLTCLFVFIFVYPLLVLLFKGKKGLKLYLKNLLPPTITALSTCSSAACIPVNINSTEKMGVKSDICETSIPIGTNFHKDGSIIGSCFKIMFLVSLFSMDINPIKLIGVALLVTLLVTAVPIGGGTISEMMILTLLGFPLSSLPVLTIIATIIDAPATVLNVVGDSVATLMVSRMVDGKNN